MRTFGPKIAQQYRSVAQSVRTWGIVLSKKIIIKTFCTCRIHILYFFAAVIVVFFLFYNDSYHTFNNNQYFVFLSGLFRKLGNEKFHCSPDFYFEYACHRISTMEHTIWRKCCPPSIFLTGNIETITRIPCVVVFRCKNFFKNSEGTQVL